MKAQTTTLTTREMAHHAIICRTCKPKSARLLATKNHLERQELLCAIEYCAYRKAEKALQS